MTKRAPGEKNLLSFIAGTRYTDTMNGQYERRFNMSILEEAKALKEKIVEDRRTLHSHAEFGMDLPVTVAYVKKRLTEMGYEPKDCGKSGVVATVGKPGKCILLRADMDGLPMKEETGLPYSSDTDWMHSCGHDAHTAMLLGAAQILKNHEAELNGTVKFMFQPAEELLAGAKDMVENGVLEDPKVDAAVGIHIDSQVSTGKVCYCNKYTNASADVYIIHVQGKGGHGAMPELSIDPLLTASYINIALQEINSREVSGRDMAVITTGKMISGTKENIIPDTARMEGTIRTFDNKVLENVKKRLEEIAKGVGAAFRCEVEVEWPFGCGPNTNDTALQDEIVKYGKELIGEENMVLMDPSMGSEDFSFVGQKVPSMFMWMGGRVEDDSLVYPLHHNHMVLNEESFPIGTAMHAYCAMEWLKNH
jgi:amidohydrolase